MGSSERSPEDESELDRALRMIAEGNRDALLTLHQLTAPKLFGICLRICRDYQAAEDTLNEVYLNVWRRRVAFNPERGSSLSWLCIMARNRSIDWVRRYGRSTESDAQLAEMPSLDPNPEEIAFRAEESNRLHFCLGTLRTEQSDAIRTTFFDGLTYAELAVRQGVPLGTVKSRIHRGMLKLKECLNGR